MALPANISTGRVEGQFIVGVADGADPDDEPDFIPAQGTIAFTASTPYLPNPTATPNPVTMLKTTIVGILDAEGYVCTPDDVDKTKPGRRGIRLVATDDNDASVTGWTWTATPRFKDVNGTRLDNIIPAFSFGLPSDSTIDLTTVVKVPSAQGVGKEQIVALAAAANTAAQTAEEAALLAAAEASQAKMVAKNVQDRALAGEFNGAPGKEGAPGPAGPNTVPTQEAVAQYVATPGNPVNAAVAEAVKAERPQLDLVSALRRKSPIYISHRGGPKLYPEHSMEGYRASAADGFLPEIDIQALSDGTLVCLHDADTWRTMTGPSLTPANMTTRQWLDKRIKAPIPGGKQAFPVLWEDLLDELGGKVVLVAEIKGDNNKYVAPETVDAVIQSIKMRGLEKAVIIQSFNYSVCQRVAASGIEVLYLNGPGASPESPAKIKADGVNFVGSDYQVPAEHIANLQAAGITSWVWTVNTREARDAALAKGATGLMTDDPWGLSGRYIPKAYEDFREGSLWPLASPTATQHMTLQAGIGLAWNYPGTGFSASIRLGQFGSGPTVCRVRFNLQFLAGALDSSRWIGFWIGTEDGDYPFRDVATPGTVEGYHFLIRRGGEKQIFKRSLGSTSAVELAGNKSTAFAPSLAAEGGVKEFEIVIDQTTVTLRCLTDGTEATVADTSFRGMNSVLSTLVNGTGIILSDIRVAR